ncbi:hypothetical protein QUA82_02870 [Microcoleus sp. F8-D3]
MSIDTPRAIGKTLIFSLRCVDDSDSKGYGLQATQLIAGFTVLLTGKKWCVDLRLETLYG